jgi:hypothetical protein
MSTNDSDEFDPRFDPAFQRGFDAAGTRFRSRASERAAERAAAQQPVAQPIGVQPVGVPAVGVQPVAPALPARPVAPPLVSPVAGHPDDRGDGTDAAADPSAHTRGNPFLIALAVVSVALVAGGVWGVQAARAPFLGTEAAANVDYSGIQMLMTFAPMAIALGIATAVGILFVYAVRWRGGR